MCTHIYIYMYINKSVVINNIKMILIIVGTNVNSPKLLPINQQSLG